MKTIAYTCSYETNENTATKDISKQIADIKNFCTQHKLNVDEIYTETSSRDDFKPVLLNIMSNLFGVAEKIIITNPDVISRNDDFLEWIKDEFKRMKIEIIFIKNESKPQELITPPQISLIKEKIKNIPSLPEIITKSIEIMQDKNASAFTLSKIISNDIGLTARVLKLVNSSYYGFPKQISTIHQAIIILGFTTIKGIILSASIFKMFTQTQSFDYKNFWKHSILVATGTRLLAKKVTPEIKEDLFSAAFLHDIGKIIFAQYDWENYSKITGENLENTDDILHAEEKFCGLNHCEIANIVAYSWNLPEIFCDTITYHHNPLSSEKYKRECSVIYIANLVVKELMSNKKLNINNIPLDIIENINISCENIDELHGELIEIYKNINDIDNFFD